MVDRAAIDAQIREAMELLQKGHAGRVVIATYTREEFARLRPCEDYDDYKRRERLFAEGRAARGLLGRIIFQHIDAAGFRRWLADHPDVVPDDKARVAYASFLAIGTDGDL